MSVAIVTDSSSDISPAEARTAGIDVLPLWMVYPSERLRDGVDLSRAEFYARLAAEKDLPHSEPIDQETFAKTFARHAEAGDEVVATVVSSGLSKTYENAKAAAAAHGSRVQVIDSQTFSGGIWLQAMAASEMAKAGASAVEVAGAIEAAKSGQHGFLIMPDLTYLGRSGRLNKAIVALGTVLKVVPILQMKNGTVETAAQTRSYDKAQELLIDIASRNAHEPNKVRFAIGHTHAPALAERVAEQLKAKLGLPPKSLSIYEGGPAVALHGGPGAIGVFSIAGL